MKYELTAELMTGNSLIDSQHKELIAAINSLLDACASGRGREQIAATVKFLNNYVVKHFKDEEKLQETSKYPNIAPHKVFHTDYIKKLAVATATVEKDGATVKALSDINLLAGQLISHIKFEDKKVAAHVKSQK